MIRHLMTKLRSGEDARLRRKNCEFDSKYQDFGGICVKDNGIRCNFPKIQEILCRIDRQDCKDPDNALEILAS